MNSQKPLWILEVWFRLAKVFELKINYWKLSSTNTTEDFSDSGNK